MAQYHIDINESYNVAAPSHTGTTALPFCRDEWNTLKTGVAVNGISIITGDTIRVSGRCVGADGNTLFGSIAMSLSIKSWHGREPWYVQDDSSGARASFGLSAPSLALDVYDGIIDGIKIPVAVSGTTVSFYNCMSYGMEAGTFYNNNGISARFYNCTFVNEEITVVGDNPVNSKTLLFSDCVFNEITIVCLDTWDTVIFQNKNYYTSDQASIAASLAGNINTITGLDTCDFDYDITIDTPLFNDLVLEDVIYLESGLPLVLTQPSRWNTEDATDGWRDEKRHGYGAFYFYFGALINATPDHGAAPLPVVFTATEYSQLEGFSQVWHFGDGDTVITINPHHIYHTAGVYAATCIFTNKDGEFFVASVTITVYDFEPGLLSSQPDFCFKLATKKVQGNGITPITGTWIWPVMVASTVKGYNKLNESISLVLNAEDMQFYQIGIPECWKDRQGGYGESEIQSAIMLPEIYSRAGEQENVRHIETHVSLRSYDERTYRVKTGFDENGLKEGQLLSLEGYKDGEQVIPETKLIKLSENASYAFLKELEAKRLQLKIKTTTSAFRIPKIGVFVQEIAKRTPVEKNNFVQKQYQKELSLPDIWLSKNIPSIYVNRADGSLFTGTAIEINDPLDGEGAFSTTGLSGDVDYLGGDFTVMGWIFGDGTFFRSDVSGGGIFSLVVSGDIITIADGIQTFVAALSGIGGWINIAIVRRGYDLEIYENGLLKNVFIFSELRSYGGDATFIGSFFDIRRIASAVSEEAINYYHDNYQEFLP